MCCDGPWMFPSQHIDNPEGPANRLAINSSHRASTWLKNKRGRSHPWEMESLGGNKRATNVYKKLLEGKFNNNWMICKMR